MTSLVEKIPSGDIFFAVTGTPEGNHPRTLGGNLRRIRLERKLKAKDVADRAEMSRPQYSGYENDSAGLPETPTLMKLAKAVGATIDELLEGIDPEYDLIRHAGTGQRSPTAEFEVIDRSRGVPRRDVPIVGDAEASTNGLISWDDAGMVRGEIEGWVPRSFGNRDQRSYALRVRGDSMTPRYDPGEIITVQPERVVRTGHYVCVQLTSGERLIKRAFKTDGGWILRSVNQHYPDRHVADAEIVAMHRITDKTEA